jgi:hypothetical protein
MARLKVYKLIVEGFDAFKIHVEGMLAIWW